MASLSSLQGLPGERGVAGPEGKPVSGVGSGPARLCGVSVCPGGVPAMVCVTSEHPSVSPQGPSQASEDLYVGGGLWKWMPGDPG